jgi:hypothetical protein
LKAAGTDGTNLLGKGGDSECKTTATAKSRFLHCGGGAPPSVDDFRVSGEKTNNGRAAISVSNCDDGGLLLSRALLFSFSLKTPPF